MSPDLSPARLTRRGRLVYLSGAPGTGKSTLMAHLTRACPRDTILKPFAHDLLRLPSPTAARDPHVTAAVELGRRRDLFSGTDALSMSVITVVVPWLAEAARDGTLVLGEGDRLGNVRFLEAAAAARFAVTLVHLEAPDHILDSRCEARGSTQSENWRTGRRTKARRLADVAEGYGHQLVRLDSRNTPDCLSRTLVEAVPDLAVLLPPDAPEVQP